MALASIVIALAVLLIWLADMHASRAFPVSCFLVGAFITLGGFLSAAAGPVPVGFPRDGGALVRETASRDLDYGSYKTRERLLGNSVVYAAFGIALIAAGAILDALL
jgi:hypothetical protein